MNTLKLLLLVITTVISLCFIFGFTQDTQQKPDKEQRIESAQLFNQKYNNQWTIRMNNFTGTPASILGHTITKYSGTPEKIAKAFLNEEKTMLGIDNVDTDLELVQTHYLEKFGTTLQYRQKHKGIQILGSGYLVAVDNSGAIYYVSGDYFPDIEIDTKPSIGAETAEGIISSDLAGSSIKIVRKPELFINVQDRNTENESYKLVYKSIVIVSQPHDELEYKIDALNGTIISKISIVKRYSDTGWGWVYLSCPLYGDLEEKILLGLNDPVSGYYYLDGANVEVWEDYYDPKRVSSETAEFYYDTTSIHFDEVAAYYHFDKFERFLWNLGLETNKVPKIKAYTHDITVFLATSFLESKMTRFRHGAPLYGLKNPMQESAVIAHEYMHHVIYALEELTKEELEDNAMEEAYADYFGLAYESDAEGVRIDTIFVWVDEPGGYNWFRSLVNNWTYDDFGEIDLEPNGESEEHDNSVIFSGALWDFRWDADIDEEDADILVFSSIKLLDDNATFLDARDALLALASSTYDDDIVDAFNAHKIYHNLTVEIVDGPDEVYWDDEDDPIWTAEASGGVLPYSYQWYKKYTGQSWTEVGENSYQLELDVESITDDFKLKVEVTDDYNNSEESVSFEVDYIPYMEVEIEGPDYLYENEHDEWSADVSGGESPYSYQWKALYPESGDPVWELIYWSETSTVELGVSDLEEEFYWNIRVGEYFYLKVIVTDDASKSDSSQISIEILEGEPSKKLSFKPLPKGFKLEQNYPNPFNPVTTINFQLPKASNVTLVIYNIQGQEVARLVDGYVQSGYHSATWDASSAASGIYIYRLQAGEFSDTKRMMLIK